MDESFSKVIHRSVGDHGLPDCRRLCSVDWEHEEIDPLEERRIFRRHFQPGPLRLQIVHCGDRQPYLKPLPQNVAEVLTSSTVPTNRARVLIPLSTRAATSGAVDPPRN